MDVFDTFLAYAATPQGMAATGMAFMAMVMVRRANRGAKRRTD